MKKLIVLKSLVDFVWIVTCIPMLLIMAFYAVYMFINPESIDLIFDKDTYAESTPYYLKQIILLVAILLAGSFIYCLYLFRKTLRYFQKVKPFHIDVIKNFKKIGLLLSVIGTTGGILIFVMRLVLNGQFKISLGFSPYVLLICLGLFFVVLSEIFTVAKKVKEENDLTI